MDDTQTDLFPHLDGPRLDGHRDGETYQPEFDYERLNRQQRAVYDLMRDGQWRTLQDISHRIHAPEASVSARLRDFRKARFGGFVVDRRRTGLGFYYRLVLPENEKKEAPEGGDS